MSIVAAAMRHGVIAMAADSLALFGDGMRIPPENARAAKIVRVGDALLGGTGWAVYDDILDHWIAANGPPSLNSRREIYAFFLEFWKALGDRYSLVNEQAATKETPFGDLDASFLVASRGGLFNVSSDLGVTEFRRQHAIGSGAEYALGAMHALDPTIAEAPHLVQRACEAAIAMDTACGGPIDLFQIECDQA